MKLIILDRDGVINQDSDNFIKSVDEWIPIPGSLQAIAELYKAGYTIAVVTNQSGIARGLYEESELDAMHDKMQTLLADLGARVEVIFHCPHGPDDGCDCRKPLPGMFRAVSEYFNISLQDVIAVGDSFRDLQAARELHASPILVKTGKGERTLTAHAAELEQWQVPVFDDLAAVARHLLDNE